MGHVSLLTSMLPVAVLAAGTGAPPEDVDEAVRATMVDLQVAQFVLQLEFGDRPPSSAGELMPLSELRSRIDPLLFSRLPRVDAWGEHLWFWSDGKRMLLVSAGSDGALDEEYDFDVRRPSKPVFTTDEASDLILHDRRGFVRAPGTLHDRQALTVANLRSIAVAMETYAVAHERRPGPTRGAVEVEWLAGEIEPAFIRELPRTDGWSRPLLVSSDGERYVLVSLGADGEPDFDYADFHELPALGETDDPNRDIIVADGELTQWPRGTR